MSSSTFLLLSQKAIGFGSNGKYGWAYLPISRIAYTIAIRMKTANVKDLGVKSKGMVPGCMLKIAAASAIG